MHRRIACCVVDSLLIWPCAVKVRFDDIYGTDLRKENKAMNIGAKITEARRQRGITQSELAEQMCVTRQTVSRWEAGTALPDVEKVACIAKILQVSCDYLLKDEHNIENNDAFVRGGSAEEMKSSVTELLQSLVGKRVKISFYEDEGDFEIVGETCTVVGFEGNWMRIQIQKGKLNKEKLLALASVLSFEILGEEA